jgi:hypothetical protein
MTKEDFFTLKTLEWVLYKLEKLQFVLQKAEIHSNAQN